MLVRLRPRGQVYRHVDRGDYYQVRHRFHVMLALSGRVLAGVRRRAPGDPHRGNPLVRQQVPLRGREPQRRVVGPDDRRHPPPGATADPVPVQELRPDEGGGRRRPDAGRDRRPAPALGRRHPPADQHPGPARDQQHPAAGGPEADSRWRQPEQLAPEPPHPLCRSLPPDLRVGRAIRERAGGRSGPGQRRSTQPPRQGLPAHRRG